MTLREFIEVLVLDTETGKLRKEIREFAVEDVDEFNFYVASACPTAAKPTQEQYRAMRDRGVGTCHIHKALVLADGDIDLAEKIARNW